MGQKREKVKFSQKSDTKLGCFLLVLDETWGKVGCFLQKLAIFKKGLSRFCPGCFSLIINVSLYETAN